MASAGLITFRKVTARLRSAETTELTAGDLDAQPIANLSDHRRGYPEPTGQIEGASTTHAPIDRRLTYGFRQLSFPVIITGWVAGIQGIPLRSAAARQTPVMLA
jgi:hypothetical protein